jgi:PEP-CTERM motif
MRLACRGIDDDRETNDHDNGASFAPHRYLDAPGRRCFQCRDDYLQRRPDDRRRQCHRRHRTDGTTGILNSSNIIGWNLELKGVGASINLQNTDSVAYDSGSDLSATANDLSFNYDGTDDGFLVFQVNLLSGAQYYCNAVTSQGVDCTPGASVIPQHSTDPSAQHAFRTGNQVIGTVASVLPEPSSWALMLVGVGGLGVALRSVRDKDLAAAA